MKRSMARTRRRILGGIKLSLAAGLLCLLASGAQAAPILNNGDFEANGGSFQGWTVLNQPGSFPGSNWFIQTGTLSPQSGFTVPAPPGPTHAAMTAQGGPGSHVLYQDFVVPTGVTSAVLSFDRFIGNRAGAFFSPNTLNFSGAPNQQARVDIITPTADPFSVAAGDVLLNLFQTQPGNPLVSGYTTQVNDLTAFLQAREGQTLRLRFAEVDNQLFFHFGVDRVDLDVNGVGVIPEPSSLVLGAVGAGVLLGRRWRRRQPVA